MVYILDTNIIRKLLFHFPKKGKHYEPIWRSLDSGIESGTFISVDECFNELKRQFSKDTDAFQWISKRKKMFINPGDEESIIMCQIFANPKFRESVRTKNILENWPSADAYIVAKGKFLGATVVTAEEFKPGSAQIPNLCQAMGVAYIGYDDFMEVVSDAVE